jgi:hypothetical protein
VVSYEERLDRERWRYLCALRRDDPVRYRQILERGIGTSEDAVGMSTATLDEALKVLEKLRGLRNPSTRERGDALKDILSAGAPYLGHLIDALTPRPPTAPPTPASPGANVTQPTPVPSPNDCGL